MPEGAVLYMTFDEGTVVYQNGRWIVKDLSRKGNHGIVHGRFAGDVRTGKPLVFRTSEDVPAEYDLALVRGPSGKPKDYAMYFAGKNGYILLPNSEGKGWK